METKFSYLAKGRCHKESEELQLSESELAQMSESRLGRFLNLEK